MTKIVKRLALLMLMLPFVACEETNYETDEFVGKKTITQLSTDNFLTFASFEELEKKVEEISQMTYEEQIKEEESKGFVSIDRIYEEITLAEEELLKPYENLTVEELTKMPRITSAIHDMYSDILITDTLEGGGLLELPNANPNYAKVLNRKSIVKVGDKIYQFKKNETKIIEEVLNPVETNIIFDMDFECTVHPNTMDLVAFKDGKEIDRQRVKFVF